MSREQKHFQSGAEALAARCVTEQQARKKDCCVGGFTTSNRGKCVASDCMAWRWHYTNKSNRVGSYAGTENHNVGYCGRAGEP